MRARDADRGLTAGNFASLLARLGPDAETAGAAYEHLRRALVNLFTWRGATTPEECADETLDRLARRLAEGTIVEDVPRFARGIARLVLLEHWRSVAASPIISGEPAGEAAAVPDPTEDVLSDGLDRCLQELPVETRDMLLQYYSAPGPDRIRERKRMANVLGVTESALRNRAQRGRDRLERCILQYLATGARAGRGGDTK